MRYIEILVRLHGILLNCVFVWLLCFEKSSDGGEGVTRTTMQTTAGMCDACAKRGQQTEERKM